jgi:L-iditol 2-dehydrogenase
VSMRAARLHGPGDMRVAGEPVPAVPEGSALVRVTAVGICGSDLHWWSEGSIGDAELSRPLVLGHEAAGEIADGPRRGERVAIDPAIPCERCRACRDGYRNLCPTVKFAGHRAVDGALREFVSWPDEQLIPLPEALSDADGAILEPLGVAIQCVDLGHLPFGGSAAVVGCGPIGLLLIQLLRAAGASRVLAVEPLAHRRDAAARAGADDVCAPGSGAADLAGYGVDVAFEAAGNGDAVQLAIDCTRPGGRIVLAGIPDDDTVTFSASSARRKGLTIALVRRMNDVYPRAIALTARGTVNLASVVTATVPLTEVSDAFTAAAKRTGLKIIVDPRR